MTLILPTSFYIAAIISLTAYLQSRAPWWKGLSAAVFLFIVGSVTIHTTVTPEDFALRNPVTSLPVALWFNAILIGIGSLVALGMRQFLEAGRIFRTTFFGIWALTFFLMVFLSFT